MEKEKEKLIDVSKAEDQGCFGHDVVDRLDKPGFYRIALRNYDVDYDDPNSSDVTYVDVHIDKVLFCRHGNMQIIHSSDKGVFDKKLINNWAYYNGAERLFKPCIEFCEVLDEVMFEVSDFEEAKKVIGEGPWDFNKFSGYYEDDETED